MKTFVKYNPNPLQKNTGDCVIRMLTLVTGESWGTCYANLALKGLEMAEMPSANVVWISFLQDMGFKKYIIPNSCPSCYTIQDFCNDHPTGLYVVGTGTHVVAVLNGQYYDSWDSGDEIPVFYLKGGKLSELRV
jgi:hypothetical protein